MVSVHPKLPMRDHAITRSYYLDQLGFEVMADYGQYLILRKDNIELHFFEYKDLDPLTNYGQVYIRVRDIDALYQSLQDRGVAIHPNGGLETKPWGQREFSVLDPDVNLITFGESV